MFAAVLLVDLHCTLSVTYRRHSATSNNRALGQLTSDYFSLGLSVVYVSGCTQINIFWIDQIYLICIICQNFYECIKYYKILMPFCIITGSFVWNSMDWPSNYRYLSPHSSVKPACSILYPVKCFYASALCWCSRTTWTEWVPPWHMYPDDCHGAVDLPLRSAQNTKRGESNSVKPTSTAQSMCCLLCS